MLLTLAGAVLFYALRDNTQLRLDGQIARSLELTREGARLLEAGEYESARSLLQESLALNKLTAETFIHLAYVEYNMGNYQRAYEHFMSAFNMEVTSVDMVEKVSGILLRGGHDAEAVRVLERGLLDFPGEARLQTLLEAKSGTAPGE